MEINYASFCGLRTLVIPGPRQDASKDGGNQALAQYSRAVQEAINVGNRMTFLVHIPMYREPGTGSQVKTLVSLVDDQPPPQESKEVDIFTSWNSWNHMRSVCDYDMRLFVGKFYNPGLHTGIC